VVLWRARLPVAAVLLGCAVALALADLRPAPPPRTPVVVTARALDAGAVLEAGDLAIARVPPDAVPDGAHADPDAVAGRVVVVAVPAGLPVVDALLRDDRLAAAAPPGTVVVPLRLADPGVADLLRPGDRVDLFAAATSATGEPVAQRLAERALVLPHPVSAPPDTPGLLGPAAEDGGRLTLVAVAPADAAALAGAAGWAGISAVVVE
jgi:Flp pilus assembly protein CpaB